MYSSLYIVVLETVGLIVDEFEGELMDETSEEVKFSLERNDEY